MSYEFQEKKAKIRAGGLFAQDLVNRERAYHAIINL